MKIAGRNTVTVINQRETAFQIIVARVRNGPIGRRVDRRTFGRRDVDTEMRRLRLAIEDSLTAKDSTHDARGRPVERLCEAQSVGVALARLGNRCVLSLNALLGVWGRRHERLR